MFVKIMVIVVVLAVLSVVVLLALVLTKPQIFDKRIKDEDTPISFEDSNSQPKSAQSNTGYGNMSNETIGDTKSFYPVKSFEDYAINLGRHNYRAIIECSSINYSLMSEIEQQMVEDSYTQFLNSLNFPISIYIQTREFDSETMLMRLDDNIVNSKKMFPNISEYADLYYRNMENLTLYIGNSKIKKKYIIVPYNNFDLSDVSALSNYEIKQFALEELMSRCSIVVNGMNATGISAKILTKPEIAECLYSYYHRDTYKIASDIIAGEFTTLAVNSTDRNINMYEDKRSRLDLILNNAQERIKEQAKYKDISKKEQEFYQYIYETLESFKQDAKAKDIFTLLDETEDEAVENGYKYERYLFRKENERPIQEDVDYSSLTVPQNLGVAPEAFPVPSESNNNSGIFTSQNTEDDYIADYSGASSPPPIFDFGDENTEGNTDILTSDMQNYN